MNQVDLNDAGAICWHGEYYNKGRRGLQQVRDKVNKLWEQAVALGSSQAHFQLGIYFEGGGIQRKPSSTTTRPRLWLDMNCQDADLEQWRQNLEMWNEQ